MNEKKMLLQMNTKLREIILALGTLLICSTEEDGKIVKYLTAISD